MTKVIKWLYRDNQTRNSGTAWELWDGHITADHVFKGARHSVPHFAAPPVQRIAGFIDACMFGCKLPLQRPRDPIEGEECTVSGYPAGCGTLEHRYAKVLFKRPEHEDARGHEYATTGWIGQIDQPRVPFAPDSTLFDAVYGGMSGGLVSARDGTPLGVLVTQNGLADLDGDGVSDDSFDFVALSQIWEAFTNADLVA